MKKLKFIDLFAGIGGFRIALEELGAECVFSSEIDKHCAITYKDNFGAEVHGDITKIDESEIPNHDIICGGFPCQPFSISGNRLGFEDSRGTLFFDIVRIANEKKPKVIFLENVANLAKHNDAETVKLMIETLESLNYDVYHKILSSSDYGVPQIRKRLYFVAFRKDLKVKSFDFPEKKNDNTYVEQILEKNVDSKYIVKKEVKYLKDDIDVNVKKTFRLGIINKGGQGDRIYSTKGYGITLSANGGGNAAKTGGYLVDGKARRLTPRECARMQGFPESFIINPLDNQAYKQFGNSVSVPVILEIGKKIEEALKKL